MNVERAFAPILLVALGLTACSDSTTTAPASAEPTAAATADPSFVPAEAPPSAAETACLQAVANETGSQDVKAIRYQATATSVGIFVAVGGSAEPWFCLADRQSGSIRELLPTGVKD